jgi:uncharacterized SAM-dependent methyltransferase
MPIKDVYFNECIKNGYSVEKGGRVWDISNPQLIYLAPELAKGFLSLKNFKPYKKNIIDRELALIRENVGIALKNITCPFNLIDLGCGDGSKAEVFIKSLKNPPAIRYCPVDVNRHFLDLTIDRIGKLHDTNVKRIRPMLQDFERLDNLAGMLRTTQYQKNVFLLLGSTLASFDINEFLFQLSKDLFPGDTLIIGNGIRTGKRFVALSKYKHEVFDKWFTPIVHYFGFSKDEVKYDARFTNSRLELFYHILVDKTVKSGKKKISFKAGDKIIVVSQYKYYAAELEKFCKMYFSSGEIITDKDGEYALLICKK